MTEPTPAAPQQWQPQPPPPGIQSPRPPAPGSKPAWWRRTWAVATLTGLVGLGAGAASGGTEPATTPTAAPTVTETVTATATAATVTETVTVTATVKPAAPAPAPKPAAPAPAITEDGTYEVGVDIRPGRYKAPGGGLCYWARLKNTSGDFDAIIANSVGSGRQVVTIAKTDKAFETRGCGEWTRVG